MVYARPQGRRPLGRAADPDRKRAEEIDGAQLRYPQACVDTTTDEQAARGHLRPRAACCWAKCARQHHRHGTADRRVHRPLLRGETAPTGSGAADRSIWKRCAASGFFASTVPHRHEDKQALRRRSRRTRRFYEGGETLLGEIGVDMRGLARDAASLVDAMDGSYRCMISCATASATALLGRDP